MTCWPGDGQEIGALDGTLGDLDDACNPARELRALAVGVVSSKKPNLRAARPLPPRQSALASTSVEREWLSDSAGLLIWMSARRRVLRFRLRLAVNASVHMISSHNSADGITYRRTSSRRCLTQRAWSRSWRS